MLSKQGIEETDNTIKKRKAGQESERDSSGIRKISQRNTFWFLKKN